MKKSVKKYAFGGQAATGMANRPAMPSQANVGGASRGLERAAAMSGRTMPTLGMKKGGKVKMSGGSASKRADGVAHKGKTKGKMVKMAYGGKC